MEKRSFESLMEEYKRLLNRPNPPRQNSLHNLLPSANADAPRPPRRLHVRQN